MKSTRIVGAAGVALLFSVTSSASAVSVTFEVNLAYQITNAARTFDPLNDTVEVRGDFNNDNWSSGFPLVRVGDTTSYTNTYDITSPSPGGLVQFKFHTYGPGEDNWESLQSYIYTNGYGNRTFVLSSSAQILPRFISATSGVALSP